ncbi:CDGSH iron-sulfur domain-containing protein [Rhodobium gokarnense]|uniref:CDGSH-type Zn-finger protein n=1 Tax=Rhodobium gokarnense TaxID=364296 RepID=A0ABT3HCW9_9HYPH|nr:CDGSH iron-sulfur domain-containing protein [Rhodobium gokarnense]MCW2308259.1 CDGSH-type Zn-finger protein [Rhodobium gokarnense]
MTDPVIAQKGPYVVTVEEGKSYFWCACGRSKDQPFCDGSHTGTGFLPVRWKADASGEQYFCGCKHTRTPPFCDGTHETL